MLDFASLKNGGEEELAVNITSLIDVIFILLIFFMVSTQFKKNALPLDLPRADSAQHEKGAPLTLAVSEDSMELDGVAVSMEELEQLLADRAHGNPETALSFECSRTVDFERAVQALSKIKNAGISRIGIVHDPLD